MEANKIYYMHLRHYDAAGQPTLKGGMTLAFELTGVDNGMFIFKIGKSICSPRDNFSRPKGREIARDRLDCLSSGITVHPWNGIPMGGEVRTRHTLNEDIHNTLHNWAYGAV